MIEKLAAAEEVTVAGHRGYKAAYPENTLLSFRKAVEAGASMLEFDLRRSKDGVVAVIHDDTVDRTTNGTGAVRDHTWEELRGLDAGGWFDPVFEGLRIPSLTQLCEELRAYPDLLLNVEIKPAPDAVQTADQAVAMLQAYGLLPRCVFTSFDAEIVAYLHDTYGLKTQGFLGEDMLHFQEGEQGTYSKMWAIAFPMGKLTKENVETYRSKGLLTWCYCPDTEAQVDYALECGAGVLTCNDPVPALHRLRRQEAPRV
ncbi:glycerophosphodiester phosphodiesterase family protein [Paenibacillus caseinilyticus]|uniref:Glycerophosphoryl diester phosphodiesterase n=1 Tax=Paenibacillus mucilaginosus K02 TaxID=997761 RepID=I0BD48_9BACL|nr:glycerophosphodiester phosphodiesterase family protein [Paenibacillus mucilaginosus]AFH60295.1 glycerophosphoryl diester phosphodiesterase [Paenibacillus mucilaginosus K02]